MTAGPKVFVVVLNWNNAAATIECLTSLFRLDSNRYQVVICDNASTDGSVEAITAWLTTHHHSFRVLTEAELGTTTEPILTSLLVRNSRNYGYAAGNNRGLRYALTFGAADDYVWILNNDVILDPAALAELIKAAIARPTVSFFGSTILDYQQRQLIQTQGGDQFYPAFGMSRSIGRGRTLATQLPAAVVEAKMSYVVGAAVFVRLSAIRTIGLMEEEYFLYFEEADWATRARRWGLKIGYVPGSLIYHREGGSIGSSAFAKRKSYLADYYGVKNRLTITRRLFPWFLPTVYGAMLFTFVKRLMTGQLDRAWMVLLIMLGLDRPPHILK